MDIAIHAPGPIGLQARAYIEYRMFSAIGRFGRECVRLSVRLDSTGARHRCSLALDLERAGQVRVRATADHAYAAVDRSAQRLLRGVERRLAGRRAG